MRKRSIYDNLIHNPKNIRFEGLCHAAEKFGFVCRGGKGSHRIYVMEGIAEIFLLADHSCIQLMSEHIRGGGEFYSALGEEF